ncbi:hypothetical protein PTKIN_Ptkin04bG0042600 [Pterospermum kingtungense]
MFLQLGRHPTVVVSSAEIVREIVKKNDAVFSDRHITTPANVLLYGCNDIGFAPYGEYWRQLKKICVVELLTHRRVQSFQFARDEEVELVINKISRASVKGESINLSEIMMAFSNNVVSRCAIGRKLEEEDGKTQFGLLLRKVMVLILSFCVGDMFPYLRWVDMLTGLVPSLKATSRETDTLLGQIIDEHRDLKSHNEITNKKDFVSIILQLQKEGML